MEKMATSARAKRSKGMIKIRHSRLRTEKTSARRALRRNAKIALRKGDDSPQFYARTERDIT